MALDPNKLDSLPNTLVDMYGLVEIDILSDMARRISTYDYFIPAALHQKQKLEELGAVHDDIIKALSAMTGKTQTEIVDLLTEAGKEAIQDDVDYYTRAEVYKPDKVNTEALYEQLNAGLRQTQQAFFNITGTTANTATKQFEYALDRAWTQINTGGFDYNTAIKNAITDLSSKGLGAVTYKSGRVDSIEVAVRRAVMTGANQTAMRTQEKLADQLEVDLVEVTAHSGARPSHATWQGKVFSRNGRVTIDNVTYEDLRTATGYGSAGGLGGVNCRHNFHPYVHGTSRTWSEEQLKALEAKEIEYNGEKYTQYEASQIQRKIERDIRAAKRTVSALEAGGQDASDYRAKLRELQKSYTDFTAQTGIKKQSARTQIATGAGATTPAKKEQGNAKNPVDNSQKTAIMSGDRANNTKTVEKQAWSTSLKQTERAEIMRALNNATDGELEFWAKNGDKVKGDLYNGSGYYHPATKTVHLNINQIDERNKRVGQTKNTRLFFHETGHLFDYQVIPNSTIRGELPDLRKKLMADAIDYVNKLFTASNLPTVKTLSRLSYEQQRVAVVDLLDDPHLKNAVSDLFGGMTGNKVQGRYGHAKSYWKGDALETEAIAHLFEAKMSKGERLDVIKKYFPETYKYFDDFMKTLEGSP